LNPDDWPLERLHKANRNYAMDYMKTALPELVATLGPGEAGAPGNLAGNIIGGQYYRQIQALLGTNGDGALIFVRFMAAMAAAQDDGAECAGGEDDATVRITGWRLMRGLEDRHPRRYSKPGTVCGKAAWLRTTASWPCKPATAWTMAMRSSNGVSVSFVKLYPLGWL